MKTWESEACEGSEAEREKLGEGWSETEVGFQMGKGLKSNQGWEGDYEEKRCK